jgi:hypothetical protein
MNGNFRLVHDFANFTASQLILVFGYWMLANPEKRKMTLGTPMITWFVPAKAPHP